MTQKEITAMPTSGSESRSGLVMELAEEFLDRYRQGERLRSRNTSIAIPTWPMRSARCSRRWR